MPPVTLQNKKSEFTELLVARIENVHIENEDAIKVLRSRNVPEAFHRLDPPYMNADQGHYRGYSLEEYEQLLKWCAFECSGKFLLSNYNSDILSEFVKKFGWQKKEVIIRLQARNTKYMMKDKTEVLVWNYPLNEGQGRLF